MGFVADIVSNVVDTVGGLVGGAAEAVASNPALMAVAAIATGGAAGLLGPITGAAASGGLLDAASGMMGGAAAGGSAMGAGGAATSFFADGTPFIPGDVSATADLGGQFAASNAVGSTWAAQGALGTAGNVLKGVNAASSLISGVGNILNPGQSPQAATNQANPNAPYQANYAAMLNNLVGNPSLVNQTPGYQFGMDQGTQSLNRTMAATGQTQSGGQQVALSQFGQNYAGQQYQQQVGNLQTLATGGAAAGQQAGAAAQSANTAANTAGVKNITAGLEGLFGPTGAMSFWG